MKVKSLSHVRLLVTHGLQPTRLLRPWDFPGEEPKNYPQVKCQSRPSTISIYIIESCATQSLEDYLFSSDKYSKVELLGYLVLLPGKSHGQRNLVGYSPWGREESDTTE